MIPAWLQAVLLGIVQGLTEFIPVSSSGHLVLVPYLLGWEDRGLAFDVMLHLGTLGAVLIYFRREIWAIASGVLGLDRSATGRIYRRVGLLIIPASVPIALVGLLLEDRVAEVFESPLATVGFLVVTAGLLTGAEAARTRRARRAVRVPTAAPGAGERVWEGDWRAGRPVATALDEDVALPLGEDPADPTGRDLAGLTARQAMAAGVLQAVAVLPGISRSGATITGGMFAGLTREAATRFSFLLAVPALVGATALSLPDVTSPGGASGPELALGVVAAFASGYAAIRFLVRLVASERLTGFAVYCLLAAAVGGVGHLVLGPPGTV